jgi:RAB protein geranylgeranyltransferase component A
VRVLLHTNVVKYLEFKAVDGSYVLSKGKIHKVRTSGMLSHSWQIEVLMAAGRGAGLCIV